MHPEPTPPSQADLDALLAYELTCAQIHALRSLLAIAQDLSNPKEARIAATAILRFKLPKPPADPAPAAEPDPHARHLESPTTEAAPPRLTPAASLPNAEPAQQPAPASESPHTRPESAAASSSSPFHRDANHSPKHRNGTHAASRGNTSPPPAS